MSTKPSKTKKSVQEPQLRAHLVALRRHGRIEAWQLRVGTGGPGLSRSFAARKYGGEDKALAEARRMAEALGLELGRGRGGSPLGRRNKLSPSPSAGIRFEWQSYAISTVLSVVATWPDPHTGRPCSTRYSVERNGLAGALDKALERRRKAGAPPPDRTSLLLALEATYRAGPAEAAPAASAPSSAQPGDKAQASPVTKAATAARPAIKPAARKTAPKASGPQTPEEALALALA